MFIEGLIGEELFRIRLEEYQRDARHGKWNWVPIQPAPASGAGARRRVGDFMIRVGGRIANIRVDPCLEAATSSPAARI